MKKSVVLSFVVLLVVLLSITIHAYLANHANHGCRDCHVILLSIDTLRADHLGLYGYFLNTSPNLDRFSQEAYVFTHAISQKPTTTPGMFGVMVGKFPYNSISH